MKTNCSSSQKGFSLFMALVMLVAVTMIAVALIRSVDTTNLVTNNIAFKQGTLTASDVATEAAVSWIMKSIATDKYALDNDLADDAYFSTNSIVDFNGQITSDTGDNPDWITSGGLKSKKLDEDAMGNKTSYIINRMCNKSGNPNVADDVENGLACIQCKPTLGGGASAAARQGSIEYGRGAGAVSSGLSPEVCEKIYAADNTLNGSFMLYKITSRTIGPKNSISYVETVVAVSAPK